MKHIKIKNNPASFFASLLFLPFILGLMGIGFAYGAAPHVAISTNFLALFCGGLSIFSLCWIPIPWIFRWNWKAKFLCATLFPIASCAGIGIFPFLSIVAYGSIAEELKILMSITYIIVFYWWGSRFFSIYRKIFSNEYNLKTVYVELPNSISYIQSADNYILDKKFKFNQYPSNSAFLFFFILAILTIPFSSNICNSINIPIIHVIISIASIPVNLTFSGLATRCYIIYYYYPSKLKNTTGKDVYVRLANKFN